MLDLYSLSIIIFIGILIALLIKDRDKIERKFILFTRRTEKGRDLLDKIAKKNIKFWKYFGTVGVLVGFGGMIYGLYFLTVKFYEVFTAPAPALPPLSIVLPIPSQQATIGYGFLGVPFWFWIIPIVILIFSHEGMHGIMMRVEKLKIKSLGLLLLAIIPGAFVEPDEKELKKKNWKSQLRIYAGGSYANILMGAVFWLILTFVMSPLFFMPAVGFLGYVNPSEYNYSGVFPAQEVNLTGSILKIDGQRTEEWNDLVRIMNEKKPGDFIEITTTKDTYSLQLVENPERPGKAFMGILTNENLETTLVLKDNYREASTGDVIQWFTQLFAWIMLLNIGIGIVNLLPIKPLDGGLMMETLINRFVPKQSDFIVSFFAGMSLMLILGTFLGGFI